MRHAARKPPNITHSVRIAVNTGGGKGQCYSKRKKRKEKRKKERRKTQNNKREEKKERMRKLPRKIPNLNYKIAKKT